MLPLMVYVVKHPVAAIPVPFCAAAGLKLGKGKMFWGLPGRRKPGNKKKTPDN